MKKNFDFTKGMYVSATRNNETTKGLITEITKTKVGLYLFKVKDIFYHEDELVHAKPCYFKPTEGEMAEIKKAYPILKKEHIKVMYEVGHDTPNGFVGSFGFAYEKGEQRGNLIFTNGEFSPMRKEVAEGYGF